MNSELTANFGMAKGIYCNIQNGFLSILTPLLCLNYVCIEIMNFRIFKRS